MPTSTRPSLSPTRPPRVPGVVLALLGMIALTGCASPRPSGETAPDGLLALVADAKGTTTLSGWDASGGSIPIRLPDGETVLDLGRSGGRPGRYDRRGQDRDEQSRPPRENPSRGVR